MTEYHFRFNAFEKNAVKNDRTFTKTISASKRGQFFVILLVSSASQFSHLTLYRRLILPAKPNDEQGLHPV